ncbi:MAG: hypothetical protein R3C99_24635 [Pirellulaceae bacterium]
MSSALDDDGRLAVPRGMVEEVRRQFREKPGIMQNKLGPTRRRWPSSAQSKGGSTGNDHPVVAGPRDAGCSRFVEVGGVLGLLVVR